MKNCVSYLALGIWAGSRVSMNARQRSRRLRRLKQRGEHSAPAVHRGELQAARTAIAPLVGALFLKRGSLKE